MTEPSELDNKNLISKLCIYHCIASIYTIYTLFIVYIIHVMNLIFPVFSDICIDGAQNCMYIF